MAQDHPLRRVRLAALFRQLVVARPSSAASGGHRAVYRHPHRRVYLPAHGGAMDVPPAEDRPARRRVQRRERILHAGDRAEGERVFRQPSHPLLVQGQGV